MAFIGSFPTQPGFQSVNFKMEHPIRSTRTQGGRTVRISTSTTLWGGTLRYPPMLLSEFLPIQGFLARVKGGLNEFDLVIPTISQSSQGYTDDATVALQPTGTTAAGQTSITVSSALANTTILNPGDVIRFPNHTKVYMVTNDSGVTTDSAGEAEIFFEPELITNVSPDSGSFIQLAEVPFRMTTTNVLQEMNYRTDGLIQYELDVGEVL